LRDPTFSHFSRTPTWDRQTYDYGIYRASMASRGKNCLDEGRENGRGLLYINVLIYSLLSRRVSGSVCIAAAV